MYNQIVLLASVSISAITLVSCGETLPPPQFLCQAATRALAPRPKLFNVLESFIDEKHVGVMFELTTGGRIGVSNCYFNDFSNIEDLELIKFDMTGFDEENEQMLLRLARSTVLLEKIKLY